jgi:hypothetical protein
VAYQTASKVLAAIRLETTAGTIATVTGATQVRLTDSPGLKLNRAEINSNEKRSDSIHQMPRLGYKSVDGSINGEISVGGATDILHEAITRAAFATAVNIGFATLTTVAVGTNVVTAAAGDWVGGQGVRVGDIFNLAGTSVSGNHAVNARVLAVTSLTITVPAGTFTTLAASATGTLTILKKLKNPTTATPRSYSVEQYDTDIDLSEVFIGCQCVGVDLSFKPGQMATAQYTFLGINRTALATGASPYFTSPTLTTSLQLVADDSTIYYNGASVATFTGMDLSLRVTAAGVPVIGSLTTPQIFDNDLAVTGSITGLRSDFSNLTLFDAETEFEISMKLQEPTGTPPACWAYYFPRAKIASLSAPLGGADGAKIETLAVAFGPKTAATGYDGTVYTIHSSAA